MEYRRLGRLGHQSSVLIYGAASLGDVSQSIAEESIALALQAGINHIDVAASYGEAELRLGPLIPDIRDKIFLATKTGDRDRETAWSSINRSLERLQTDHLALIQLHGVNDLAELDKVTASGGALESLVRAREEGIVTGISITGHSHAAPATHLEALARFDFDTVLTPLNRRLWLEPGYAADFASLVTEVQTRDVGLMTIKMTARRNWDGPQKLSTWYEPFTEQAKITAALAWLLNKDRGITGLATAGETRLLEKVIRAEQERATMSAEEAADVLDRDPEYESVYNERQAID